MWQQDGTSWAPSVPGILSLLKEASITDCLHIPRGSNFTFLVTLTSESAGQSLAIYKPLSGEIPLWDFPHGTLYKREYASFLVSEALGWRMVAPTVIRNGPHGIGSVQLFIESDESVHYLLFHLRRVEEAKKIAAFDIVTNNADRKSGHCLEGFDGRIWLIDNGLTFNTVPKLRTVVWDFQGETIPEPLVEDIGRLREELSGSSGFLEELVTLLSEPEISALRKRLDAIIRNPVFPRQDYYRSVPWPPI